MSRKIHYIVYIHTALIVFAFGWYNISAIRHTRAIFYICFAFDADGLIVDRLTNDLLSNGNDIWIFSKPAYVPR